uniref:Mammalian ependymin-related protein 1-like n=1 Tax=Phallusia mammillata TaxID=59560 RepID=A0A6F9DBH4_9ASCI|nr:mammalian ependymin-related protein 1-like [Phallusia mammillata]
MKKWYYKSQVSGLWLALDDAQFTTIAKLIHLCLKISCLFVIVVGDSVPYVCAIFLLFFLQRFFFLIFCINFFHNSLFAVFFIHEYNCDQNYNFSNNTKEWPKCSKSVFHTNQNLNCSISSDIVYFTYIICLHTVGKIAKENCRIVASGCDINVGIRLW